MPGPKTNEREGTRAVLRHSRQSAYKVREVLDLIRNKDVAAARDILRFCERDAAFTVGKLLDSAVANAVNNDGMEAEDLFVSACFADEGTTVKRWRPRARGRATRIRKRTCHVTLIVSRLPDRELQSRRAAAAQGVVGDRRRRRGGAAAEPAESRGRPTRRRPEDRGAPKAPPAAEPEETTVDALLSGPEAEGATSEPAATQAGAAEGDPSGAGTAQAGTEEQQAIVPEEESK
jgi:large subunit ribosomal protein L22